MTDSYGIITAELYLPKLYISQSEFEEKKKISKGKITIGLGQKEMSFVSHLEDVNSMALTVLRRLLERTKIPEDQIGKLEFASETLHDKSKSSKTILMQLFKNNKNIEGVTNINACYAGTAALFNCISWGKAEGRGRYSIVVTSDIAVYDTISAQPTAGAGAIAMLLGPNPVFEIEPFRFSQFEDKYDFYKPHLEKEAPVVNGKLSIRLYNDILIKCYEGLKNLYLKEQGKDLTLNDFDYFLLHCPFSKQVEKAFLKLFFTEIMKKKYGTNNPKIVEFFNKNPDYKNRKVEK